MVVRVQSFPVLHFPPFSPNTGKYGPKKAMT